MSAAALLLATALDRALGDPPWLWRRVPHPVVVFGAAIGFVDRHGNRETWSAGARRAAGTASILALVAGAALIGLGLERLFAALLGPFAFIGSGVVGAVMLAQRSLADHVRAVAEALEGEGIEAGRRAVSMIVGRDVSALDGAGVSRAAIESLAENASDGVVAPWLFLFAFGLPGILAYKMLNTADSMIGHMSPRHRAFGWAAARLDDAANWPAARLTALLFAGAAWARHGTAGAVWRGARRDGPLHRSPNAGWPEAAMAGALGLALGGPRRYGALEVDAPTLNGAGRRQAGVADIRAGLALFARLCDALLLLAVLALILV